MQIPVGLQRHRLRRRQQIGWRIVEDGLGLFLQPLFLLYRPLPSALFLLYRLLPSEPVSSAYPLRHLACFDLQAPSPGLLEASSMARLSFTHSLSAASR